MNQIPPVRKKQPRRGRRVNACLSRTPLRASSRTFMNGAVLHASTHPRQQVPAGRRRSHTGRSLASILGGPTGYICLLCWLALSPSGETCMSPRRVQAQRIDEECGGITAGMGRDATPRQHQTRTAGRGVFVRSCSILRSFVWLARRACMPHTITLHTLPVFVNLDLVVCAIERERGGSHKSVLLLKKC